MLQVPPAVAGMREEEIDTPALVIDLDAFEFNLDTMAALLAPTGVKLRAHAKTHKSPVIAKLQMARGAVGNCVQKVAEAEVLAWGGIPDILVSNEVVGAAKLARLSALSRIAKVAVCADDAGQVAAIEAAAADAGVRMTVPVEIDVGAGRCGVQPGPDAVALAVRIAESKHLIFGGLQAYHGSAQHKRTLTERRSLIGGAVDDSPPHGGATATARTGLRRLWAGREPAHSRSSSKSGIYTEMQAGSYVFMDADYGRNLDEAGMPVSTFRHALFVLSTVMSQSQAGIAVLDAGHKAVAVNSGLPTVWQRPDVRYTSASDEHGKLQYGSETAAPKVGEKVRLVPGHCDPTVDKFDWYVGVRKGRVECLWPVAARGGLS